jgi:hypothetical protein
MARYIICGKFEFVHVLNVILKGKGKGKIAPVLFLLTEHHAMKAYWGNGGTAPRILDLGSRWE